LTANVLIPLDVFLGYGIICRYVLPCALTLGPMFFAGVIFAQLFRNNLHPAQALGANIAGSVVGAVTESFSMLLGFRYLLLLAMIFYALTVGRPKNIES
jgi:ABC-type Fe3+-siderophore transport system permease subunit